MTDDLSYEAVKQIAANFEAFDDNVFDLPETLYCLIYGFPVTIHRLFEGKGIWHMTDMADACAKCRKEG